MVRKFTIEYVRDCIKPNVLRSNIYDGNRVPLDMTCPEGHDFKMRLHSYKEGQRCPECARLRSCHDIEYVRYFIRPCVLRSKVYINSQELLDMTCQEGHDFKMRFSSYKNGDRCPKCALIKRTHTIDYVRDYVKPCVLRSDTYNSGKTPLDLTCQQGHDFKMRFNDYQQGQRCPHCPRIRNKSETKISEYLSEMYDITNQFMPDFCPKKKYDIAIEELKIIIEVDGNQHFSQISNWGTPDFNRANDVYKMKCALENGYRIIRIYQPDILNTKDWREFILHAISSVEKVIYISSIPDIYDKHKQELAISM